MAPIAPLTDEELILFQEDMIKKAKTILDETNNITPVCFILTRKMELDSWLRATLLDSGTWAPPTNMEGDDPGSFVFLVVPCIYDDPKTLLHMIKYLATDPAVASQQLDTLIALGPAHYGKTDPEGEVIKIFHKHFNMSNKDIVAAFLRKVVNNTNAHAFVKIDEAWYKEATIEDGLSADDTIKKHVNGSLEDDEEAKEMFMSYLETKTFKRLIQEPFEREERDVGKITSWGERKESLDKGDNPNSQLKGRFCNLLFNSPVESIPGPMA